jgi:hypothetical protein
MNAEFRAGEQVAPEQTWKCICGGRVSEHDEVAVLEDGEQVRPGDVDFCGDAEAYFCSRDCAAYGRD